MYERNFETRIASIRKNLSTQSEKLDKLRQDRYENMQPKGVDRSIFLSLKSLAFEQKAGKKGAAEKKAVSAAPSTDKQAEGQVEVKKSGKKGKGSSKSGLLKKKIRASFELGGASIADMDGGKGVSTQAARELQVKKDKQTLREEAKKKQKEAEAES